MVVCAAVTVLVNPSMWFTAVRFPFVSRKAKVLTVAAVATPVPVGIPFNTGVVKVFEVRVCVAASVTTVSELPGNVIVVPSVPAKVKLLLMVKVFPSVPAMVILLFTVKVFPAAMVKVPVLLVMVKLLSPLLMWVL